MCRLLMPSVLGTPQIDNEYFSHNDAHNDAPSVSVWVGEGSCLGGTRPAGDGPPKAPSVTLERRVSYCERLACYI